MEEFMELEEKLADPEEQNLLKSHLQKLGGTNFVDHMKRAMLRTMSNKLMSVMNVDGRNGKVSFKNTRLFTVVSECVLSQDENATETSFKKELGTFLKYAPDRQGGRGRKKIS
ncbi:uncharacterized protein LOC124285645 [Haliotis rubra]|uniref:uncharacterized protein LOC124285645 n=1 Tax=Haliotis rubra TaxID=36100 RepID=UPI001EE54AEB|nr:uncharacterized protein LOC124285645 [Haliotis rubra]